MTEAEIRAEAAEAEREAHGIYAAMERARNALAPDADGSRPYIPAGFEAEVVRAGDLLRHVRALRADADEMRAEDAPPSVPRKLAVASVPVAISPNPAKVSPPPANPVDEVEAMAAAILASDQPAPPTQCDAEVAALAAAILASDTFGDDEDGVEAAAQAILGA